MKILIDTRIWSLGLKAPFLEKNDPHMRLATQAASFLKKTLNRNTDLLFSSQLIAEIYHVLTQRGKKMPPNQAKLLIGDLLERGGTLYRPISQATFLNAMGASAASGIHLWDYLVVLPFEDMLDRIYTMDPHFRHASFQTLCPIENPLGIWKTEGQK